MYSHMNSLRCHKLSTIPSIQGNDENLPVNFQKEGSQKFSSAVEDILVPSELDKDDDVTKISYYSVNTGDTCLMRDYGAASPYQANSRRYSDSSQSSDFGEVECGESLEPQHLTFDFTPSKEDTEFVQQKCFDFWSFIYSLPQMKDMMVIPEPVEDKETSEESPSPPNPSPPPVSIPRDTAVEFVKKYEGTLPHALCTKQPTLCRDKDYRSYVHGSTHRLGQERRAKLKLAAEKASKDKLQAKLPSIETTGKKTSPGFLKDMCSELEAWDKFHPKSYDPPTVPLPLTSESSEPSKTTFKSVPQEILSSSNLRCSPCGQAVHRRP